MAAPDRFTCAMLMCALAFATATALEVSPQAALSFFVVSPRFDPEREKAPPAKTRAWLAAVLFLPASAVAIGAVVMALAFSHFRASTDLLPVLLVGGYLLAGALSWRLASRLRPGRRGGNNAPR